MVPVVSYLLLCHKVIGRPTTPARNRAIPVHSGSLASNKRQLIRVSTPLGSITGFGTTRGGTGAMPRPLGYELTSRYLPQGGPSHTFRLTAFRRPACFTTSRLFAPNSPRSVPTSVPNTANS